MVQLLGVLMPAQADGPCQLFRSYFALLTSSAIVHALSVGGAQEG
jgi:hypothetical protein